ncbi:MAG: hypothetical protein AABY96_01410 [Nitrospirota bacterium]
MLNAVIVFDEENSFPCGYRRHGCLDDRQHGARLSDARKVHGESRTLPRLADDIDVTLALFEDAVDCCQPQADPFIRSFGGEEGFENMRQSLRIHSAPGVLDENFDEGIRHGSRVQPDELFVEVNAVGLDID